MADLEESPTTKYISAVNPEIKEEKETVNTPTGKLTIGQRAFSLNQEQTKKPNERKSTDEKRQQRFSLLLTISQRETLEHIAYVKGVSINELIGQFINRGIANSKNELDKWERIQEVLD